MEEKKLNPMCNDCSHLGKNCSGETKQLYSGCIWKKASDEDLNDYLKTVEEVIKKHRRRKTYQDKKETAREAAQKWQSEFSDHNYSYEDLARAGAYFEKIGKRYGLLREFKENGIL